MMNKIEIFNFIKKNWYFLITIILMGAIIVLILFDRMCENDTKRKIDEIEYIDSIKTYHKLFYEKKFSDLKKENKSLYDSLKKDKDIITYLLQFTSKKEYNTGKVATNKVINTNTAFKKYSVYTYTSEPNDTMWYKLQISSIEEPSWYSINFKTTNKFTIVNKDNGDGLNHITISDSNKSDINDVTVFKKKEKTKLIDRFAIGPSIGIGYDPVRKQISPIIGLSVTIDLKKRK